MPPNQPGPDQTRNLILAMILMMGFLFAYQTFVVGPQEQARREAARQQATEQAETPGTAPGRVAEPAAPAVAETVEEALQTSERVVFDGPGVDGSVNLTGARLDDLKLKRHFMTVERDDELRLLRPENSANGYYATYGWLPEQGRPVIGVNTQWRQKGSAPLSPGNPVTLIAERGGLTFERTLSLDDNYMFTYTDRIVNNSGETRRLTPFGVVRRHGEFREFLDTTDPGASGLSAIVHLGLIGVLDRDLKLRKYKPLSNEKGIKGDTIAESAGWMGFTDKYWMTALVPRQGEGFETEFNLRERGDEPLYELLTQGTAVAIPAGGEAQIEHRVFAGAKRLEVLRSYEDELGLPRFTDAIDWGMFWFLTKPFFQVLLWLEGMIGSFGWAILAFTVLVKLPLIPLYNQSYKSMAKMKLLAEPMKEIQEKYKDDPKQRQQEVMKLYQREKANPIAGCLPILATIPIFYALYKTLFVTLEMRHEPFGYLRDLSAPDPTAIGNLFGLLPWAAADVKAIPILGIIIGIGVLPILYGVTMAALQSLSPPPPDPTQRMVMMALPVILTFVFGGFAAGLVLYWVWNNILSLMQQYFIMRRNGVETQLDKLIAWLRGKRGDSPAE
ncbi:MAG: membrane protein insertase YidC [Alphaproteobacteria bacterium]|jgi:YidC/Oxa1 family membrane protein insertase|nr:membrane protein insertase YidC [Alphaproteobacteria bacterium]